MDETQVLDRAERCLRDRIYAAAVFGWHKLEIGMWPVDGEPVPFAAARAATYEVVGSGAAWGTPWSTTWFHVHGEVPEDWDPAEVDLDIDLGWTWGPATGEALVYDPDGAVVEGLGPGRPRVPWRTRTIDFYIEAAANPMPTGDWYPTDSSLGPMPDAAPRMFVSRAQVVRVNRLGEAAANAMVLAIGVVKELTDPAQKARGLAAISAACDVVDDLSLTEGNRWVEFGRALAPLFAAHAAPDAPRLHAVANAHLDTAWLWPFREAARKAARSFSNALAVMDDNPQVTFACSQVQHLAWVADRHPDLMERIRKYVAEGRWLIVGGTWVEPDGNMPAGESFARQFLLGQTWLQEHLGVTADIFWLPDTFGYSAGLPQIARGAGCETFVTQKLSWNSLNVFPHTTMLWEGLDGSRLLTHFPPADTYSGVVLPMEFGKAQSKMAVQPVSHGLFLYGFGDGGGGPTREMLDRIERMSDLAGLPRIEHDTFHGFFDSVRETLPEPPVWSGELYLEYHRGVLTSQARLKQAHRRVELLLREAEIWATSAALQSGYEYPAAELREAWRELLVMQFHDVLPGTSIGWVHDEAMTRLAEVETAAEAICGQALSELAGDRPATVFATASPHGNGTIPAFGASQVDVVTASCEITERGDEIELNNDLWRVVVSQGLVTSFIDRATGRDLVPRGAAIGRMRMHPDRPIRWDAWDLDEQHTRGAVEVQACGVEVIDDASVLVRREWRGSTIEQNLRLTTDGLQITTDVDWHAQDCLLRLECDLDLLADTVAAETMYGFIERPTAANTTWDQAKFETSGHRWLQLGEPGYGMVLLTPTTYGHRVTRHPAEGGGVFVRVAFSLLRSAAFPDPRRDAGHHRFTHVVVPRAGIPDAVRLADEISFPVRRLTGRPFAPVVEVTGASVSVEAVKLAEDASGDVIVRVRETCGTKCPCSVQLRADTTDVRETDLVERDLGAVDPERLILRPFQVRTLRFVRG